MADGVGHIAIRVFSSGVPARVHGLVRRFEAEGMRALVLDLRGNPGGDVTALAELAGDFLEPGSEMVTVIDGEGDETTYRARGEGPYRFPLAVLVDRRDGLGGGALRGVHEGARAGGDRGGDDVR